MLAADYKLETTKEDYFNDWLIKMENMVQIKVCVEGDMQMI